MTIPQIPAAARGNLALDISQAGASLAAGLQAEKARRREEAMADALMELRRMQAEAAIRRGERPFLASEQLPTGKRQHVLISPSGDVTRPGIAAPGERPQVLPPLGPEGQLATLTPGGEVRQLGVTARPERPFLTTEEIPPTTPGGTPSFQRTLISPSGEVTRPGVRAPTPTGVQYLRRPRSFEIKAAEFAVPMAISAEGMKELQSANPQILVEIANVAAREVASLRLPLVGEGLSGVVGAARQLGLSEPAAQYLAYMAAFISARIPSRAGLQQTISEMRNVMREFLPDIGEPQSAWAIKARNMETAVETQLRAAGPALEQFRSMLPQRWRNIGLETDADPDEPEEDDFSDIDALPLRP